MNWFLRSLCGIPLKRLEACREEKTNLAEKNAHLEITLENKRTRLRECREFNKQLAGENAFLADEIGKLDNDITYFRRRMEAFQERLNVAIEVPDIADAVKNGVIVKPYEHEGLSVIEDLLCADWEYLAFPKDEWIDILSLIQPLVERQWKKNVGDCDNFALDMVFLVARACLNAGLSHQGAITITWSRSHAYNAFVTDSGEVYVYEPQNGKIIGELGGTVKPYDSEKIWFPQEALSENVTSSPT